MRAVVVVALLVAAAAAVASAGASAHSSSSSFFLTGKVPQGWSMKDRVDADQDVAVVFAVKMKNLDELYRTVEQVSDFRHPRWGRHLSVDEVNEITSDWENTGRVMAWLLANGVEGSRIVPSRGGEFIHVTLKARAANALLDASFHVFRHDATGRTVVRTPIYRLPAAVAGAVDFVSASTLFPAVVPRRPRARVELDAAGGIPAGYVQPSTLVKFYGVDSATVATAQATQSVYESLGQSYDPTDLTTFQKQFSLPKQAVSKVIGPNTASDCAVNADNCVEALLDVEYIMAMAQSSPTTFWSISSDDQTPFLDWIVAVGSDSSAPLVHSVSYGEVEQDGDNSVMTRFCAEVAKLGARGISVFVASGDDGVANFPARGDQSKCGFFPSYPANCPYVTAVGATMGPENSQPEVACTSSNGGGITTGGGFSTVFDQPSYQSSVVAAYLQNGPDMPPTSQFASTGRGYPDVSMMGHNYVTVIGGQLSAGSGTSASTPLFAALVTLVNGLRLQAGKAALGFLNPTLYSLASSNPEVFNDITSGRNNCAAGGGSQPPTCCTYGFTATTGWDPLTGLGSINFAAFRDALTALP